MTKIIQDRLEQAAGITLKHGSHDKFEQGVCLLELTAWIAGEPHSDKPECVSPVIVAHGRAWNDALKSDEARERLKPYAARMIGTAGNAALDEKREYMQLDWLIRVFVPAHYDLRPELEEFAAALRALPEITDEKTFKASVIHLSAAARVSASVWASVTASVRASVTASVRASVTASVRASVTDSVWASVTDSVWASVTDSVRASVTASVWASVTDSVRASVTASVRASVTASVRASVWDSVWAETRAAADKWITEALNPLGEKMDAEHHILFERLIEVTA